MIFGIKLMTGEEIIAQAEATPQGQLKVTSPVEIQLRPPTVPGGPPSVAFVPFPTYADHGKVSTLLLEPLHVVYTYTPDTEIIAEYNKMLQGGASSTNQIITG